MSAHGRSALAGRLFAGLFAAALASAAVAGGPLYTYDYQNRIPYAWRPATWPNGQVPVYTDLGNLGVLSHQRAGQMVTFSAGQWSSVPTSSFRAAVVGDVSQLGLSDITFANVTSVIGPYNGGGIDVIYDSDGSILTNFFGVPPTAVLGITNIDNVAASGPEILEAWMVLSGPGIHAGDPNGVGFQGVVTHEMGHALNLAHSQANGAVANASILDAPQPSGCSSPWSDALMNPTQIETMYPISTPEEGDTGEYMGTVDRLDDRSALSDIYPAAGYPASRGTISGQILDAVGNPVTGVNVIARNIDAPFEDFSSYISGQVSKGQAGPDGAYILNDLTPGARYVFYVDNLAIGAFSVPHAVVLPGPEEYYNDATESADQSLDNPCAWTTVAVTAGSPVTANIRFGKYTGAPTFLIAPSSSIPMDITPDGATVVGSTSNGGATFRWDLNTNLFTNIGGVVTGEARISDDGTKIVSDAIDPLDSTTKPAIYQNGAWTVLPPVAGAVACGNGGAGAGVTYGSAYDISGDGSTVVGLSYGAGGCATSSIRGFKWTAAGGTVVLPKANSFLTAGRANVVNYNGSVIAGWDDSSQGFRRAEVWNGTTPTVLLYQGQFIGEALEVSRDGHYVSGHSSSSTSGQAWRYNNTTHVVELMGNLGAGWDTGNASCMNDTSTLLGGYSTNSSTGGQAPTIWTAQLHWSNFGTLLSAQGINTAGILLGSVNAMSADATVMTGVANSIQGYIGYAVKIPTSVVCHVPIGGGAPQTQAVSFPAGLNSAVQAGDTIGPCPCSEAVPLGVPALLVGRPAPGIAHLQWTSVGGATGYDIARGSLALLSSSHGNFTTATKDCLESALHANAYDDDDPAAAGDGFWYLIRPVSCGGHGTYDSGAPSQTGQRDAEMLASTAVCP